MKTLRQLRDELKHNILVELSSDRPKEIKSANITQLCYATAYYIETCTDEEFEALGKDVPEEYEGS